MSRNDIGCFFDNEFEARSMRLSKEEFLVEIDQKLILRVTQNDLVKSGIIALDYGHTEFLKKNYPEPVQVKRFMPTRDNYDRLAFIITHAASADNAIEINYDEFSSHIMEKYTGQFFCIEHILMVNFNGTDFRLIVAVEGTSLDVALEGTSSDHDSKYAKLVSTTKLTFRAGRGSGIQIKSQEETCPRMTTYIYDFLENIRVNGFVPGVNDEILQKIVFLADAVKSNKFNRIECCLLEGPSGTGKTTLVATAAMISTCTFTYVDVMSPQLMIGYTASMISRHILKVLETAHRSLSSFIIIDDIERLIFYQSDVDVAKALLSLLTSLPPHGKNIFLIGTTTNQKLLESSNVLGAFSTILKVGSLDKGKIKVILESVVGNLFQDEVYTNDVEKLTKNVPMKILYRALSFSLARSEELEFDSESLKKCMEFLADS